MLDNKTIQRVRHVIVTKLLILFAPRTIFLLILHLCWDSANVKSKDAIYSPLMAMPVSRRNALFSTSFWGAAEKSFFLQLGFQLEYLGKLKDSCEVLRQTKLTEATWITTKFRCRRRYRYCFPRRQLIFSFGRRVKYHLNGFREYIPKSIPSVCTTIFKRIAGLFF